MGKLNIPGLLIGWLATVASGDIIYGKPAGLMQLPEPASSASSPTAAQSRSNANELLTGAETGYGQLGHGGSHHGGLGGGGREDLAVVVTGGYKVADTPHHGIHHHGLGSPHGHHAPQHGHGIQLGHIQGGHGGHLGGHIQGGHEVGIPIQGHIQEGHGSPIGHGHIPVIEHEHGDIGHGSYGFQGHHVPHGYGHSQGHSHGHGIGHYGGHHQGHHTIRYDRIQGYGYGLHVPSHGLVGHHHRGHGYGHHHHHHGQGGFKPILAPVGHGYGYGHHHLQGHGVHGGTIGGHHHGHGAGILGHGGLGYAG